MAAPSRTTAAEAMTRSTAQLNGPRRYPRPPPGPCSAHNRHDRWDQRSTEETATTGARGCATGSAV